MSTLNIEIHDRGGKPTLVMAGRLVSTELARLQHVILTTLKKMDAQRLGLDLANVDYIDSLSIGRLIALSEVAKKEDKRLVIVNPHPRTREVLSMLKIDSMIELQDAG